MQLSIEVQHDFIIVNAVDFELGTQHAKGDTGFAYNLVILNFELFVENIQVCPKVSDIT